MPHHDLCIMTSHIMTSVLRPATSWPPFYDQPHHDIRVMTSHIMTSVLRPATSWPPFYDQPHHDLRFMTSCTADVWATSTVAHGRTANFLVSQHQFHTSPPMWMNQSVSVCQQPSTAAASMQISLIVATNRFRATSRYRAGAVVCHFIHAATSKT